MEQATAPAPAPAVTNRRLQRTDGPLGGVAAGMAEYFAIDPVLVRLGLVATTLLGGPTIPIAYLAAWVIIPDGKAAPLAPTTPAAPAAPLATTPPPPPPAPPSATAPMAAATDADIEADIEEATR